MGTRPRAPRARKQLRFGDRDLRVLGRRSRSRSPPRNPGGAATAVPHPAVPRAATPRKPTQTRHAATHQDAEQSAHKSPRPWPCINKVYMFPPEKPLPIHGYHGWETEYQACKAFDRPPRNYLSDKPIYPWLPRSQPEIKVSFKLGFQ